MLTRSRIFAALAASGVCSERAGMLEFSGSGTCTLTASQPGDGNVNAAEPLVLEYAVLSAAGSPVDAAATLVRTGFGSSGWQVIALFSVLIGIAAFRFDTRSSRHQH